MDEQIRIGQQVIRFDHEATIAFYERTLTKPGTEKCNCTYCKNFAAQRTAVYPEQFRDLLNKLGADSSKELEAFDYDFGQNNPHRHLYGGWFVFCGELIEGAEWRPEDRGADFSYWFTANFPTGGLPQRQLCAVEFLTSVPWVLPETPEQNPTHDCR